MAIKTDWEESVYEIEIKHQRDGEHVTAHWETSSIESVYDAIHTAAGALLAGAESVTVTREDGDA